MPFDMGGSPSGNIRSAGGSPPLAEDLYQYLPPAERAAMAPVAPITAQTPGSRELGRVGTLTGQTAAVAPAPAPSVLPAASAASAATGGSAAGGGSSSVGGGASTDGNGLDLAGLTSDELSAMLQYIAAQTGLTVEQLSQQAGSLGDAARQMMTGIQQQYALAVQGTENDAVRRGIFNSGILARNVGRVGESRTRQEGKVRSDAESKLSDLQLALNSLVADNQLQAAQAGSQILQANLPVGEQAALQNRLADLNLGSVPDLDLSQIVNQAAGSALV